MANFGTGPGFSFNYVLTANCLFDLGQSISPLDFNFYMHKYLLWPIMIDPVCWGPPAPPWSTFLSVTSVCSGRQKARFPDERVKGFSVNGAVGKKGGKRNPVCFDSQHHRPCLLSPVCAELWMLLEVGVDAEQGDFAGPLS